MHASLPIRQLSKSSPHLSSIADDVLAHHLSEYHLDYDAWVKGLVKVGETDVRAVEEVAQVK